MKLYIVTVISSYITNAIDHIFLTLLVVSFFLDTKTNRIGIQIYGKIAINMITIVIIIR